MWNWWVNSSLASVYIVLPHLFFQSTLCVSQKKSLRIVLFFSSIVECILCVFFCIVCVCVLTLCCLNRASREVRPTIIYNGLLFLFLGNDPNLLGYIDHQICMHCVRTCGYYIDIFKEAHFFHHMVYCKVFIFIPEIPFLLLLPPFLTFTVWKWLCFFGKLAFVFVIMRVNLSTIWVISLFPWSLWHFYLLILEHFCL